MTEKGSFLIFSNGKGKARKMHNFNKFESLMAMVELAMREAAKHKAKARRLSRRLRKEKAVNKKLLAIATEAMEAAKQASNDSFNSEFALSA
jgi:hypothetical protein